MTGCLKHGNEHVGSMKSEEFLDQLSEHRLLKKNSIPWSYFGTQVGFVCVTQGSSVTHIFTSVGTARCHPADRLAAQRKTLRPT